MSLSVSGCIYPENYPRVSKHVTVITWEHISVVGYYLYTHHTITQGDVLLKRFGLPCHVIVSVSYRRASAAMLPSSILKWDIPVYTFICWHASWEDSIVNAAVKISVNRNHTTNTYVYLKVNNFFLENLHKVFCELRSLNYYFISKMSRSNFEAYSSQCKQKYK
jgi:hypothetical protein